MRCVGRCGKARGRWVPTARGRADAGSPRTPIESTHAVDVAEQALRAFGDNLNRETAERTWAPRTFVHVEIDTALHGLAQFALTTSEARELGRFLVTMAARGEYDAKPATQTSEPGGEPPRVLTRCRDRP